MRQLVLRTGLAACACAIGAAALVDAQGAAEWTTSAFDAQRTRWVRSDPRINAGSVKDGTFQFLWKATFDNEARQLNSLTEPVLQDWLIGYRGFKSLAFVGGSADRLFSIDTDLAKPYFTVHLNYAAATGGQPPSSWECPGGLMATPSRRTAMVVSSFGGGGGGGGSAAVSAVGEPGKGAAVLEQRRLAAEAQAKKLTPPADPPPPPTARRAAGAPVPFGGVDPLYVVAADGLLRTLRVSDGSEMSPSVKFLPPSSRASSLIYVDGFVYTTTANGCGAAPNAVWALDVLSDDKKVRTWNTGGPSVAGTSGPTFGTTGTLYVALGKADAGAAAAPSAANAQKPASYANSVVALDRETLEVKDWFTADGADFNAAPTVVRYKDRDLVAATANDGKLYLLDGASLGGADHKTPLAVTAKYTAPGATGGLATWEADGTRWVLAPAQGAVPAGLEFTANGPAPRGSIVAFKVADAGGKPALEPAWQSRDLASPLAPIVVNGVVFAAGSGEYRGGEKTAAGNAVSAAQRAQRSIPAVLVALDAATGKQMWTSGQRITSFARAGLSAGGGQVYLVTYDNHLYAFGIPIEH